MISGVPGVTSGSRFLRWTWLGLQQSQNGIPFRIASLVQGCPLQLTFGLVVGVGHWPVESRHMVNALRRHARVSAAGPGAIRLDSAAAADSKAGGLKTAATHATSSPYEVSPSVPADKRNFIRPSRGVGDVVLARYGLFALLRMRRCRHGLCARLRFSRGTSLRRRARGATLRSAVRALADSRR